MKSFRSLPWAGSLLLLFAVGCSGAPSSVAAEKPVQTGVAADGTKEYSSAGLKMSLPKDWTVVDLTAEDLNKVLDDMAKNNPNLQGASDVAKAAAASGAIKIMAFDVKTGSKEFTDNMNLNVLPLPEPQPSLQKLAEANATQIESIGVKKTDIKMESINGTDVAKLTWGLPMKNAEGVEQQLSMQTYIFIRGKEQLTFTFGAAEARAEQFAAKAEKVMQSLTGTK